MICRRFGARRAEHVLVECRRAHTYPTPIAECIPQGGLQ